MTIIMIEIILGSVLGSLVTLSGLYVMAKRLMNSDEIGAIAEDLISEMSQNEEIQKELYTIGGYLGSGLRSGLGIQKRSGKRSWQDVAVGIAEGWIQQQMTGQPSSNQAQGAPPSNDSFKSKY